MFDDLNVERNHLKNEWILKHFFRSADPSLRKPVTVGGTGEKLDVNTISSENSKEKKTL
jgi:hypothetical protein